MKKEELTDGMYVTTKGIHVKIGLYSIIIGAFILGGVWWQINDIAGDIKTEKNDRIESNAKIENNINQRFNDLKFFIAQGNNNQSVKLEKIVGENKEIKQKISKEPKIVTIYQYETQQNQSIRTKDTIDSVTQKEH